MKLQSSFIPNIFTMLNLFSGFLAILQIFQSHFITAIMLIILAAVFDGLDGQVARLLHQESKFGLEFDSLADMVSFCAAPAILIYFLFTMELKLSGAIVSFFPLLFGGIRLARFNIQMEGIKKRYFIGLPTPTSAMTIVSYVWFNYTVFGNYGEPKIALPMIIVLSFLMISNVRFPQFPQISFHLGMVRTIKSVVIILGIAVMAIFRGYVIFPVISIVIITYLLMWAAGYEEPRVHFLIRKKNR